LTGPAEPAEPKPEPAEAPPADPAPRTEPAPTPSPAATGRPGIADPRESDASSLEKPLEYKPGKPLAGKGIEITTVRPDFGTTVRMLANPDNPLIIIEFKPDGSVARARFARSGGRTLNTGNSFVDGAILDAVYRWKARGEALEQLEPGQTLRYTVRLLLRG
ncbi:MAG: hypothetical protein D6695_07230, partial [Planctomycetota bacterium]